MHRSAADLPDNVYAETSAGLPQNIGELERARIQWAWMADSRANAKKKAAQGVDRSQVRADLLDVVRLLSSCSIETQTMEPSYVMKVNNVHMETDRHRSIATQIGVPKERANKAMQVVEVDIIQTNRRGINLYTGAFTGGSGSGDEGGGSPGAGGGAMVAHTSAESGGGGGGLLSYGDDVDADANGSEPASHYRPTCDIPHTAYPIFMPDARAQGVANKYSYISLPQHVVQLPPRRRRKFITPTDVAFLYGGHELALDERATTHLSRAHALWSHSAGFVPKY